MGDDEICSDCKHLVTDSELNVKYAPCQNLTKQNMAS